MEPESITISSKILYILGFAGQGVCHAEAHPSLKERRMMLTSGSFMQCSPGRLITFGRLFLMKMLLTPL